MGCPQPSSALGLRGNWECTAGLLGSEIVGSLIRIAVASSHTFGALHLGACAGGRATEARSLGAGLWASPLGSTLCGSSRRLTKYIKRGKVTWRDAGDGYCARRRSWTDTGRGK